MEAQPFLWIQFTIFGLLIKIVFKHIFNDQCDSLIGVGFFLARYLIIPRLFHTVAINLHGKMLRIRVVLRLLINWGDRLSILFFRSRDILRLFIFLDLFTVVFKPFSSILFSWCFLFKSFALYVQNLRIIWSIELLVSEFRLVLTVIVPVPHLVEIIHVQLSHKWLVSVMTEVFRQNYLLELLNIFNNKGIARFTPMYNLMVFQTLQ